MILNRPVYIEAIGASPIDAYVARNGSLLPLTLHLDPLDAGGLPALVDEATAHAVQSVAAITQAKALDTYLELRANATDQSGRIDEERARRNLMAASQAQVAGVALGFEVTPHDTQNLMKAMEGTGQASDPAAVGKILDLFIRGKQVFGSALTSDMMRDFVQNAKAANFALGDRAFVENMVRMTEGNASRLGTEVSQTMQTLVGGHMTAQTGKWLLDLGLVTGLVKQGGGKVTATGLKGSALLQTEPVEWANQVLLPAISGVLSEKNVQARMKMLRDDALKMGDHPDDRVLRERAEHGLIAGALSRSGMRTTVTDQLAHAIANERLISRDVAGVLGASSSEQAAGMVGQNPIAAASELMASLSNLASIAASGPMRDAAPIMNALAHAIANLADTLQNAQTKFPKTADAAEWGGIASALGFGAWLTSKLFGRFFGGGAAAGEAAAAATGVAGAGAGVLATGAALAAPLALTGDVGPAHPGSETTAEWLRRELPSIFGGGGAAVSVTGQAAVDQTLHVDISLDPEIRARIDSLNSFDFVVPLGQAPLGRMDDDAAPRRGGPH
jgi:hypothetical protein